MLKKFLVLFPAERKNPAGMMLQGARDKVVDDMNNRDFYPQAIQLALGHDAPGAWMPQLPPRCIRLSAGYPDPAMVPTTAIEESVHLLLRRERELPLQYLGSPRMAALRDWIQHRLGERGMAVASENLLVTSGAAQAIDLVARVLMDQTTWLAVEAPTYMEALEIFRNYTDRILAIPMDEGGLRTDLLHAILLERKREGLPLPRLLYTIPSFHNPTGATLTLPRRKQLLQLAEMFDFLILEDDAYGELSFGEAPVTLKALDTANRVIHVGSLSKVVAPGLRIGWVCSDASLARAFGWFKKDLDHPFVEAITATCLEGMDWDNRVQTLRYAYRQRKDVMLAALRSNMPGYVTWNEPDGGFFVWLRVAGCDTASLLPAALAAGVSYVPGRYFFCDPDAGTEFLRLSFSHVNPNQMVQGVATLAGVIRQAMPTFGRSSSSE